MDPAEAKAWFTSRLDPTERASRDAFLALVRS
jgi:hypothetical protein